MDNEAPVTLTRDGAVAQLRFNRPSQLNAVNLPTAQAFLACCREIAASPEIRAVILSGAGSAFGAGGDLNELKDDAAGAAPGLIGPVHEAVKLMARIDAPFIASVHGVVAGGSLSLAMACDLVLAAEGTKFNLAYVKIGATCDGSASWSLPRLVGTRNAMAIALLGDSFDAAEAHRLGMVNQVVPADALASSSLAIAQRLAAGPTLAIGRMKRLIHGAFEHSLDQQLDLEQQSFVENARSHDFQGAIEAFLNKRKPVFHGR